MTKLFIQVANFSPRVGLAIRAVLPSALSLSLIFWLGVTPVYADYASGYGNKPLSFADSKLTPVAGAKIVSRHLVQTGVVQSRIAQAKKQKWISEKRAVKLVKKKQPGIKILKIRFDAKKGQYYFKVLTPNGKVRRLQIDARQPQA